jgi:hypothetical protein
MQQQTSPLSQWGQGKETTPDDVLSSSKRLSFYHDISSVTLNNTIYIYGNNGKNTTAITKVGFISSKDVYNSKPPSTVQPAASSPQNNTNSNSMLSEEPILFYSPGIPLYSTDEILVFASSPLLDGTSLSAANATNTTNASSLTNGTTQNLQQFMKAFKFGLSSGHSWSLIPSRYEAESTPIYRQEHSISLSLPNQDSAYMFGGVNNSLAQNDFWMYSLIEFQWKKLALPTIVTTRCGHTSTMLK